MNFNGFQWDFQWDFHNGKSWTTRQDNHHKKKVQQSRNITTKRYTIQEFQDKKRQTIDTFHQKKTDTKMQRFSIRKSNHTQEFHRHPKIPSSAWPPPVHPEIGVALQNSHVHVLFNEYIINKWVDLTCYIVLHSMNVVCSVLINVLFLSFKQ